MTIALSRRAFIQASLSAAGGLAIAAFAYAPSLTPALRVVNVSILVPTLAWTLAQYLQWYDRPRLPAWLTLANPVVDITAVTASMAGYGLTQSATLALRSPMFLAYFVILAARPVTSSRRCPACSPASRRRGSS